MILSLPPTIGTPRKNFPWHPGLSSIIHFGFRFKYRLGRKSLQLFDEELRANNEEDTYLTRLQGEVKNYKDNKRKITSVSLASSTNVDYYTADGYSFARIACGYGMTENGKKSSTMLVYLLRRDENRKWRIYGWETADQLNDSLEQQENN